MSSTSVFKRFVPAIVGAEFEKNTERYLNKCGLRTVCRNYRCRGGEIDLVMADGEFIVFVEVRYRRDHRHGTPFESITRVKQKRIIRAASHFLAVNPDFAERPCRFDAVGVSYIDQRVQYDWITAAFST
ncbi:MAG: YraN family protein [Proteobacteria bacterium]|nr:MAG: YraN family protein [Pseudomonadota bacterium]